MNEFKFSTLRQFGSENVSFTATVQSEKLTLSDEELEDQIQEVSSVLNKAFKATQEREITEKALLVAASERRTAEVAKLDAALKKEMAQTEESKKTMSFAQKISNKISKSK